VAEKILIVDDDMETVKFLSIFLKRQGYETLEAKDGIQALTIANEQIPDLIVLDVMMPGIDGFEVTRSLRRQPETALIPILMFTAKTQTEDKETGYQSGVDIYLTKPIHPLELQVNIKALLTQKQARAKSLENKGYVVGVVAAKGGLGVSTIALNLAAAFKQNTGLEVIAVETRPGQGYWAYELGISDASGLCNLLRMNGPELTRSVIEQQLQPTAFGVPVMLATDNSGDFDCITALNQFDTIVQELSLMAGLVVLDIGTSFHPAYRILVDLCDEIILVVEPLPISVKRTRALFMELKSLNFGSAKALSLVTVNRTRSEMSLTSSQIESILGQAVLLGFPPEPELAYQAGERSTPIYLLHPTSVIAKQFEMLARSVQQHISRVVA
jgi:CheY-like chemotaxis protein/MinD-like ATPase involved in chromosome partitioning or flagellar assembly